MPEEIIANRVVKIYRLATSNTHTLTRTEARADSGISSAYGFIKTFSQTKSNYRKKAATRSGEVENKTRRKKNVSHRERDDDIDNHRSTNEFCGIELLSDLHMRPIARVHREIEVERQRPNAYIRIWCVWLCSVQCAQSLANALYGMRRRRSRLPLYS